MLAGMNGLDYAIIAIVGLVALHGLTRGAIRMATSIVSLIAGIYLASVYYGGAAQIASTYLKTGPALSQALGYAGVFGIVFVGVEYAGGRVTRIVRAIHLSWADRAAGAFLGASLGAIIAGLIVLGLTAALPDNSPVLAASKLAPKVLHYNQMLLAYVPPQVKEEYQRKRGELLRKWDQEMENPEAPRHPAATPGPS